MSRERKRRLGEFALIAKYFAPLATDPGAFGLTDDAAIVRHKRGHDLVITKDAIVAGVHFLPEDAPDLVARKLLRVNLSDLAAKGASPFAYFLAAAFPKGVQEAWIKAFAKGLRADQGTYGVALLGGDTVATPGPATFSCTMLGWMRTGRMVRRCGARTGDDLWVTGTIGDAGAGLRALRGELPTIAENVTRALIRRYRLPEPRVELAAQLATIARAALDVSDGLLQDAGHLAKQSKLRCRIELGAVPLSKELQALDKVEADMRLAAVRAGDDYEILIAADPASRKRIAALSSRLALPITRIGCFEPGSGVAVTGQKGESIKMEKTGFTHF